MGVPWNVVLEAWLPFPIVGIIGITITGLYFYHFQNQCNFFAALVCLSSVVLSMFVVILIPVDVFLISSTRTTNGTRISWADNETVTGMEVIVLHGYFVIYGMVLLFVFLLLPLLYFYYKYIGKENASSRKALLRAVQFTFASLVLLAVSLVVGFVVPMGELPSRNSSVYQQMNYLGEYNSFANVVENGLIFTINCLGLVGMLCSIIYTSYGMTILPVNLIKGKPSESRQQVDMEASVTELVEKIQSLSNQQADDQPLGATERRKLDRYSRQLSELQSCSDTMRQQSYSPWRQCLVFTRPIQIVVGFIFLLLSILIVVSLVLSNVNRLLSSYGLYAGYTANQSTIINPIDSLLLLSHKVFPIDYLLVSILLFYFTLSSVSGMQHMGMWFVWVQLHKLREGRTTVQALVFSSFVLASVTIYSGIFVYSLAPQYVTYGTQMYQIMDPSNMANHTVTVVPCSLDAPADECILTRLVSFQTRLFYRMWFFGAAYYWCSWLFVLAFIIACIVSIARSRKTIAEIMVRNIREREGSMELLI